MMEKELGLDIKENKYIIKLNWMILKLFGNSYGDDVENNWYFLDLIAQYMVTGLSNEDLKKLETWAQLSPLNKRIFDQFDKVEYANQTINWIKEHTSMELYQWYMKKYHRERLTLTYRISRYLIKSK